MAQANINVPNGTAAQVRAAINAANAALATLSSGATPPPSPIKGQLWRDTGSSPERLKLWDGTRWKITEWGSVGPRGFQGLRGEKGEKGDRGATGVKGDRGERGLRGEQGPIGPAGVAGNRQNLTDTEIGDKAFSNPPSDLGDAEKEEVRSAIEVPSIVQMRQGFLEITTGDDDALATALYNLEKNDGAIQTGTKYFISSAASSYNGKLLRRNSEALVASLSPSTFSSVFDAYWDTILDAEAQLGGRISNIERKVTDLRGSSTKGETIFEGKLGDGVVDGAAVQDGAIGTSKIADGSITSDKLASGVSTGGGGDGAQLQNLGSLPNLADFDYEDLVVVNDRWYRKVDDSGTDKWVPWTELSVTQSNDYSEKVGAATRDIIVGRQANWIDIAGGEVAAENDQILSNVINATYSTTPIDVANNFCLVRLAKGADPRNFRLTLGSTYLGVNLLLFLGSDATYDYYGDTKRFTGKAGTTRNLNSIVGRSVWDGTLGDNPMGQVRDTQAVRKVTQRITADGVIDPLTMGGIATIEPLNSTKLVVTLPVLGANFIGEHLKIQLDIVKGRSVDVVGTITEGTNLEQAKLFFDQRTTLELVYTDIAKWLVICRTPPLDVNYRQRQEAAIKTNLKYGAVREVVGTNPVPLTFADTPIWEYGDIRTDGETLTFGSAGQYMIDSRVTARSKDSFDIRVRTSLALTSAADNITTITESPPVTIPFTTSGYSDLSGVILDVKSGDTLQLRLNVDFYEGAEHGEGAVLLQPDDSFLSAVLLGGGSGPTGEKGDAGEVDFESYKDTLIPGSGVSVIVDDDNERIAVNALPQNGRWISIGRADFSNSDASTETRHFDTNIPAAATDTHLNIVKIILTNSPTLDTRNTEDLEVIVGLLGSSHSASTSRALDAPQGSSTVSVWRTTYTDGNGDSFVRINLRRLDNLNQQAYFWGFTAFCPPASDLAPGSKLLGQILKGDKGDPGETLTDAEVGDKAFKNPPNDLTNSQKGTVRIAIDAASEAAAKEGIYEIDSRTDGDVRRTLAINELSAGAISAGDKFYISGGDDGGLKGKLIRRTATALPKGTDATTFQRDFDKYWEVIVEPPGGSRDGETTQAITDLEQKTQDLSVFAPASTGWSAATQASQGGFYTSASTQTLAQAKSLNDSRFVVSKTSGIGKHILARIPLNTDPAQYRIEFTSGHGVHEYKPTLNTYRNIGSDSNWTYYVYGNRLGDDVATLTLQVTASADHIGHTKFSGTLADGIVTTDTIKDGAITQDKLDSGITLGGGGALTDGSVTTDKIADEAVTEDKLSAELDDTITKNTSDVSRLKLTTHDIIVGEHRSFSWGKVNSSGAEGGIAYAENWTLDSAKKATYAAPDVTLPKTGSFVCIRIPVGTDPRNYFIREPSRIYGNIDAHLNEITRLGADDDWQYYWERVRWFGDISLESSTHTVGTNTWGGKLGNQPLNQVRDFVGNLKVYSQAYSTVMKAGSSTALGGTWVDLTLADTPLVNVGNFTKSGSELTVNAEGNYVVSAQASANTNGSGPSNRVRIGVRLAITRAADGTVENSVVGSAYIRAQYSSLFKGIANVSQVFSLKAGDKVKVQTIAYKQRSSDSVSINVAECSLNVAISGGAKGERGPAGPAGSSAIADGSLTTAKLRDGSITSDKIANAAVIGRTIDAEAVSEEKIALDAVTTAKIKDGAVTREKLDSAITLDVTDGSVDTDKIADGAVTEDKLEEGLSDAIERNTDTAKHLKLAVADVLVGDTTSPNWEIVNPSGVAGALTNNNSDGFWNLTRAKTATYTASAITASSNGDYFVARIPIGSDTRLYAFREAGTFSGTIDEPLNAARLLGSDDDWSYYVYDVRLFGNVTLRVSNHNVGFNVWGGKYARSSIGIDALADAVVERLLPKLGSAGQVPMVNATASAVEYVNAPQGPPKPEKFFSLRIPSLESDENGKFYLDKNFVKPDGNKNDGRSWQITDNITLPTLPDEDKYSLFVANIEVSGTVSGKDGNGRLERTYNNARILPGIIKAESSTVNIGYHTSSLYNPHLHDNDRFRLYRDYGLSLPTANATEAKFASAVGDVFRVSSPSDAGLWQLVSGFNAGSASVSLTKNSDGSSYLDVSAKTLPSSLDLSNYTLSFSNMKVEFVIYKVAQGPVYD